MVHSFFDGESVFIVGLNVADRREARTKQSLGSQLFKRFGGITRIMQGTVRVEDGGRLEWCGAGEGRGSGIIVLTGSNSTLVFR